MITILSEIISTLCICIGFFFGYKIGSKKETPIIEKKEKEAKIKSEKMSKEEKRKYEAYMTKLQTIWENVDEYDGTPKNQKKL